MSQHDVEAIEVDIEDARQKIKTSDALDRLMKNEDFQTIITKGYFEDEAMRLVASKANPALAEEKFQNAVVKSIDGIGCLQQYFNVIWRMADNAEAAIKDSEEEIAEIEQEGDA